MATLLVQSISSTLSHCNNSALIWCIIIMCSVYIRINVGKFNLNYNWEQWKYVLFPSLLTKESKKQETKLKSLKVNLQYLQREDQSSFFFDVRIMISWTHHSKLPSFMHILVQIKSYQMAIGRLGDLFDFLFFLLFYTLSTYRGI